jgi:hypothetical protein
VLGGGKSVKRRTPILVVLAIVVTAAMTQAAMMLTFSEKRITARGAIKTMGVEAYWGVGCTDEVIEIDWGTLEPGSQTDRTVYVKNRGNAPVTLSLDAEAWTPSEAQTYLWLDWDYDGTPVTAGTAIPIRITLTVSGDITGITAYSFQIVIAAQG